MSHFSQLKFNLLWQVLLAVIFIGIVLFVLGMTNASEAVWAAGAGALASSAYIVFVIPESIAAQPQRVLGGYSVAIAVGVLGHLVLNALYGRIENNGFLIDHPHVFWVTAALVVGISMLVMIWRGYQHPPAVGVALILVLDVRHWIVVLIMFAAVLVLAGLRWVLRKNLRNLV